MATTAPTRLRPVRRRLASRKPQVAAISATLVALIAFACQLTRVEPSAAGELTRPNVLLIVTDDQPTGTTKRMPTLSRTSGFVRFNSYYDNNPLCCPTRATLLTGLYSHHHGVETNLQAPRFDDSSTLATWLDGAGYETGLFGKYMNSYPWNRGAGYVPPGWDRWSAFTPDASYYDYTLVGDDSRRRYGSRPGDYSTDVLAKQTDDFIATAGDPFFAYFAPYAPHAPRTPAPRHRNAFAGAKVQLPPNFNRVAKGAPRWWHQRSPEDPGETRAAVKGQWRSLLAVDDALARFLKTLRSQDELDDTMIIFVSDNGYSLGSHRYPWKDCAYEECIHLPLLIRWPGHTRGEQIDALAGSMDIAPTIAAAAGATPSQPVDGTSLLPLLNGESQSLGRPILLRHVKYPRVVPTYWGVRDERWTYVDYGSERELYDNDADPQQLRNLAGRPALRETEARLREQMEALREGG